MRALSIKLVGNFFNGLLDVSQSNSAFPQLKTSTNPFEWNLLSLIFLSDFLLKSWKAKLIKTNFLQFFQSKSSDEEEVSWHNKIFPLSNKAFNSHYAIRHQSLLNWWLKWKKYIDKNIKVFFFHRLINTMPPQVMSVFTNRLSEKNWDATCFLGNDENTCHYIEWFK